MNTVEVSDKTKKMITATAVIGFSIALVLVVCAVLVIAVGIPELFREIANNEDAGEMNVALGVFGVFALLGLLAILFYLLLFAGVMIPCCVKIFKNRSRVDAQVDKTIESFKICKTYDFAFAFDCVSVIFVDGFTIGILADGGFIWWLLVLGIVITLPSIAFVVLNRLCKKEIDACLLQSGHTKKAMLSDYNNK